MPVVAHPKLPSLDRPELKEILEVDDLDNANPPIEFNARCSLASYRETIYKTVGFE